MALKNDTCNTKGKYNQQKETLILYNIDKIEKYQP